MTIYTFNNYILAALAVFMISGAGLLRAEMGPSFEGWPSGQAHDTGRRIKGWTVRGADKDALHSIVGKSNNLFGDYPGSWVYESSKVAENFISAAEKALQANKKTEAMKNYQADSAHFGVARFHFLHSPAAIEAYAKHNEAYYQFLKLANIPVEHLRIPFEGKQIIGNLYTPKNSSTAVALPLLVISGGIDTWKNELWSTVQPMLEQGFAVFAMEQVKVSGSLGPVPIVSILELLIF